MKPDQYGIIKHRGVVKDPSRFKDWIFVYSPGKNRQESDREADRAVALLGRAGDSYGIRFSEPGFISADRRDWKKELKEDQESHEDPPQIIVFFLEHCEEKYYSEMKSFVTN